MLHSIHTHIVVYIKWADSSSLSEYIYKNSTKEFVGSTKKLWRKRRKEWKINELNGAS